MPALACRQRTVLSLPGRFHGKRGQGVTEPRTVAWARGRGLPERHESRRIDRQLRGRSGRQGDPGASEFFLSLEDDLMRLFGSERIANVMDRMG